MLINCLLIIMQIFCVVSANLLIKTGAMHAGEKQFHLAHYFNKKLILGVCFFGLSFISMVFILKRLPLNLAQAFISLQYIAVTIAAYLILKEPISKQSWFGITLIALGVIVVGRTIA